MARSLREMSAYEIVKKFQIQLCSDGKNMYVPHADRLYAGARNILAEKKPDIIAHLRNEHQEGFGPGMHYNTSREEACEGAW